MKPQSAKQKGRKFQQDICKMILLNTDGLTDRDVQSTSMGANGADIKLSSAAFEQFPYSIECKHRKNYATLYDAYEQAISHDGEGEPILFLRADRKKPLVVISAEHFFRLINKGRT